MWHFLIKVPYLGKLIYDAENKGLSRFSSDENKGLKSIATDSNGVNNIVHIIFKSFSHMHHGHSYGFLIFMVEILAYIFQSL